MHNTHTSVTVVHSRTDTCTFCYTHVCILLTHVHRCVRLFLHICMHIFLHAYVCTPFCTHKCAQLFARICIHIFLHAYVYTPFCTQVYSHTCAHTRMYTVPHMNVRFFILLPLQAHVLTHTLSHTCTHIHICTYACGHGHTNAHKLLTWTARARAFALLGLFAGLKGCSICMYVCLMLFAYLCMMYVCTMLFWYV